jgi:hypothetical protein
MGLSFTIAQIPKSQSQSYITTDGQSASMSWNKAPIWNLDQIFIIVRQLRVCLYGPLSLTRGRVYRLRFLLALASAVILGSQSLCTRDHIVAYLRHARTVTSKHAPTITQQ